MSKQIKKIFTLCFALGLILVLSSCAKSTTKASSNTNAISIQIIENSKTTTYKTVSDTTLLKFAQEKLHADEKGGLINAIDGMKSDPTNKAYLMFKVNGKISEVGASAVKLKNGDKVEFYISKY